MNARMNRRDAFACCGALLCVLVSCLRAQAHERPRPGGRLEELAVSFTVHNPGVPGEATIHGTLVRPAHPRRRSDTAVIMLHGAISDRSTWLPPFDGVPSFAHKVAREGHAVYAIDRLGYARSVYDPFPGAGWAITTSTQVETVHEVVAQVRAADCDVRRVVLVGLSLGGGISQLYATRYDDVDGIVSLGWSNQPPSDMIEIVFGQWVIPQFMLGYDHAYFFVPTDGFTEEAACFFYQPGADANVVEAVCADGFLGTSPSGELASVGDLTAEVIANVGNAKTPALLIYGEFDNCFPGPEYRGLLGADEDTVTPDIQLWRNNSQAPVDVMIVPDTGHAIPFHDSADKVLKKIVRWIDRL